MQIGEYSKGKRLDEAIRANNLTRSQLATILGTSQSALSAIISGARNLTDGFAARIEATCGISSVWLLTGIGEMLKKSDASNVELLGRASSPIMEDTVEVTFFDVNPTATFQDLGESISNSYDTVHVIPLRGERLDKSYCVFEIHGDSMSPTVLSHARILCKSIPPQQWHHADGVIVIAYASKVVLKRVKCNDLDSGNLLTLVSDNPDYGTEVVQLADIHCIYKAKRIISQDIF